MKSIVLLLLLALVSPIGRTRPASAAAQSPPGVWQVLTGSWVGHGTLLGGEAEFSMEWDRVLSGAFMRLRFHNARVTAGGADTVLTAVAYYRQQTVDSVIGIWLDSRGMMLPLRGLSADSVLVVLWGSNDTEQGKTVYRVTGPGAVTATDSVSARGVWREFGRAQYRRR